MNEDIIKEISSDLNISIKQIDATLKLLGDGNTIPFIARYRKEATGNLNEEEIRKINDVYEYQVNLLIRTLIDSKFVACLKQYPNQIAFLLICYL